MPIYEYACPACGKNFEHLARSHSAPTPPCPKCGEAKVVKQFSLFGSAIKTKPGAACASCPSFEQTCGGSSGASKHTHGAGCGCCH